MEKKDKGRLGWVIAIVIMIVVLVILTIILLRAVNKLDNCNSFTKVCPQLRCNGQDPKLRTEAVIDEYLDANNIPYTEGSSRLLTGLG